MNLTVNPRTVRGFLLAIIAALTLCNAGVVVAAHVFAHHRLFGLAPLLNVDLEANFPTWFSSMQLALAGLVVAMIGRSKRAAGDRFGAHWLILAAAFAFLSMDEAAKFHETLFGDVMRARFDMRGVWHYAWYIPYGALLAGFTIAYWRFFWDLPQTVRQRFLCAAALFLTGAVGFEMLGSHLFELQNVDARQQALWLALAYSVEEPLEMLGIALFVYAALDHAAELRATAQISIARSRTKKAQSTRSMTTPPSEPSKV